MKLYFDFLCWPVNNKNKLTFKNKFKLLLRDFASILVPAVNLFFIMF